MPPETNKVEESSSGLLGALQVLDAVFQGGTLSWSSALPASPPLTPTHILPFVGTAKRMAGRRKGMECCHLLPSLDISEDNPPSGDQASWSRASAERTNLKWMPLPTKSFPPIGGRKPLSSLRTTIRNRSKVTGVQVHRLSQTKAHCEPT